MPAYLVEHNKTSQTGKIRKIRTTKTKKPTGVLKNVTQDQKGCNKNICAEEEQITAARAKQHEDEEEEPRVITSKFSFSTYLHKKHGDAWGWMTKHVRYLDISKLVYFDISKNSVPYGGAWGWMKHVRYLDISKIGYFDISKNSIPYRTAFDTLLHELPYAYDVT